MSYADILREESARQREEDAAIERERARNAHKMHGIMCEENHHIMLMEFFERIRSKTA